MQIIDADGHINDLACGDEIASYMPKGNQMARLFPEFDHLHFRYLKQNRRDTGNPTRDDWMTFLDKTGISWTVLYPTAGLAVPDHGRGLGDRRLQSLQQLALRTLPE